MKKIIILMFVSIIVFFSSFNYASAYVDEKTDDASVLHVGLFGASILGGLRNAGFILANYGNESIMDIQWIFSIKSVSNNDIDISYTGEIESLKYNQGYQYTIHQIYGFGFVELTITATSSNTSEVNEIMNGFQIGPYTLGRSLISAWY
jgi:hypothetical protein